MNRKLEIKNVYKPIKKSNFCIGMKSALTTHKIFNTSEVGLLASVSQVGLLVVLFIFISFPFFAHAIDTNIQNYGTNQYAPLLTGGPSPSCNVPPRDFSELMCVITETILSPLIPILVTLALIAFFWGVAKYVIQGAHDEKSREQGKQIMLWGIIGLFVMVSVWGLVEMVRSTFDLGNASFNAGQIRIP